MLGYDYIVAMGVFAGCCVLGGCVMIGAYWIARAIRGDK